MYKLLSYKDASKQLNQRVYTDYFYRLMLLSKSLFKWDNLPNGLDEKWIENYLFTNGCCIFYKDKTIGYMVAGMGENGNLNYYNEPTNLIPIAPNYIYTGEQLVNNVNAIIIRNNDDMIPTSPTIDLYSMKLANLDRTIDVNVNQMKTPLIVICSDKQRLSMKNIISQRNENELTIYGDKSLNIENFKTLKTDVPVVFDKLQLQKHATWCECMTFLGINNANQDKKERLVVDEVQANDEQVEASLDVMLKARQKACKLINEMFGLNITVKRRNLDKDLIKLEEDFKINEDIKNKEGDKDVS